MFRFQHVFYYVNFLSPMLFYPMDIFYQDDYFYYENWNIADCLVSPIQIIGNIEQGDRHANSPRR